MSWWQARKARKDLEKMGLDKDYLKGVTAELKNADKLRNEIRKQESPAYVKLIAKINDITYKPIPARQRYEMSHDLICQAGLSDWELHDLLAQINSIYGEVLEARPYVQVLSGLNHIKSSEFPQAQKIALSMQLLKSYNLSGAETQDIAGQIRKIYKV